MVKISVIMPVYNVEKYLKDCLESLINQTLKDIEIICVNDGSTDSSLSILEEYQKKDDRIIIINQENRGPGPGGARNSGMEKARGEYVHFIDSDDYIDVDAFEKLYPLCKETDVDFIIFKVRKLNDATGKIEPSEYYDIASIDKKYKNKIITYQDIKKHIFFMVVSPYAKIYKREFIKDIKFPEQILFEDNEFFLETILKSKNLYILDEYLYHHRIRPNSITTSKSSDYKDTIAISNMMIKTTKELGKFEELKNYAYPRKIGNTYIIINQLADHDNREDFFKEIKSDFTKHQAEYEADDFFMNELNNKTRHIFYSGINCETSDEFILSIKLFEAEYKVKKLKKKNKKLKKENKRIKSTKAYKIWKKYIKIKKKLFK